MSDFPLSQATFLAGSEAFKRFHLRTVNCPQEKYLVCMTGKRLTKGLATGKAH